MTSSLLYDWGMAMRRSEERGSISERLVAFRLPADLLDDVDQLRRRLGSSQKPVSRSRVMREALRVGVRDLGRRYGKGESR